MRLRFWQNISDRGKFLALYIVGATIFFLFVLFPGEAVRDFVEENSHRFYPEMRINVQDAGLSPLLWVVLKGVAFNYQGNTVARADYVKVRPALSTLWGRRGGAFSSRIFDGSVRGRLTRGKQKEGLVMEARLSKIDVASLPLKDCLSDYAFAGVLAGACQLETGQGRVLGQANLTIDKGNIAFAKPAFGLESLEVGAIEATLSLEAGKVILSRCEVKGPQVAGSFSGDIMLRQPYAKSVLKIKGFITPQAALIAKLGESFPVELFLKKTPGDKGFPVVISGTIDAPRFSMK